MLKILILKELFVQTLDSKFAICYTAVFALVFTSIINMGLQFNKDYHDAVIKREKFEKEHAAAKVPFQSLNFGVNVLPSKLRVFSTGFDREISREFRSYWQTEGGMLNVSDPLHMQYKIYDLAFIVAVIISLMAIFLNYNSFNGELDERTMHLVLSNAVSRSEVIIGKLAGGYLILVVPLLIAWFLATLVFFVMSGSVFTLAEWIRLFLMAGITCIYLAMIFLMTSFFSILFRNPVVSLLCSLIAWIGIVFVLPNGALLAGRLIRPIPSEARLVSLIKKRTEPVMKRVNSEDNMYTEADMLANHINWSQAHSENNTIRNRTIEEQRRKLKEQLRFSINLSRFSPANNFLYAFTHLAGTGFLDLIHFEDWKYDMRVRTGEVGIGEYIRRLEQSGASTLAEGHRYRDSLGPIPPGMLPSKVYSRPPVWKAVAAVFPDVIVLLLEIAGLYLGCYFVFIRRKTL